MLKTCEVFIKITNSMGGLGNNKLFLGRNVNVIVITGLSRKKELACNGYHIYFFFIHVSFHVTYYVNTKNGRYNIV